MGSVWKTAAVFAAVLAMALTSYVVVSSNPEAPASLPDIAVLGDPPLPSSTFASTGPGTFVDPQALPVASEPTGPSQEVPIGRQDPGAFERAKRQDGGPVPLPPFEGLAPDQR